MSKDKNHFTAYPDPEFSEHSVSLLVDQLCDEFESSWKANHPIPMERQLIRVVPRDRSALFRELLEIELEIRTARNEVFSVQEYVERFPEEAELIDLVFRRIVRRKKLGDYELLEEIGHGGMGVVYRARQVFLNQIVAIKVLSQIYHSDPHIVSRFRREMRMIGSLNHQNIVHALNAGDSHGTLYLVMEFVDGLNLHQLVKRYADSVPPTDNIYRGPEATPTNLRSGFQLYDFEDDDDEEENHSQASPAENSLKTAQAQAQSRGLPLGVAAEIVRQAAHGLDHAWSQGMIHRDLKPANLMITRSGTVKVLDLGLGKFCAESRLNDPREAALTQIGATMGTVDYMSPEQCENATEVDIRADIYSLGCTLFFALSGKAPFDGTIYSSQRKKLLAHLEGEIPPLENFRSDCPPEFLDVFRKMVAKEPENRYQNPEELLRAISPFADAEELHRVLALTPLPEESAIPSTPALRTGEEDTLVGWNSQKMEERARAKAHTSHSASLSTRSVIEQGTALWKKYGFTLFLALAAGFALTVYSFLGSSDPNDLRNPSENGPPNVAVNNPSPPEPVVTITPEAEAKYEQVVRDLVQLPGLEGQWWFTETPWYLPYVREKIPHLLHEGKADIIAFCRKNYESEDTPSEGAPYRNPNPILAREFVGNLVRALKPEMPEHRAKLIAAILETLESEKDTKALIPVFESQLLDYEKGVETWTAGDYHTIALLRHRLAQVKRDQTLAESAAEAYKNALSAYDRNNRYEKQMHTVCLSDFIRLNYWKDKDFAAYKKEADALLALEDTSDLFKAVFLAHYGDVCTSAGQNNDTLFEEASNVLARSGLNPHEHPIAGYIFERYAWSLIDQCKFPQAREKFYEALRVRANNLAQTGNPFAMIYVLHNTHGMALIRRYVGDAEGARKSFSDLVDELRKSMQENMDDKEIARQRYFSSLQERLANTLERYGDCTLYGGGAAFGTPESRVSIADLKNAAELYDQSRTLYEDASIRYFVGCKSAIIKTLLGSIEDAKAVLGELDHGGDVSLGSYRERVQWLRQITDALVLIKEGELHKDVTKIRSGQKMLRSFLSRFDDDSLNAPRFRRETLEMQLFAAEVLIRTQLASEGVYAARKELSSFLDPLLLTTAKLENTRPFFYRFYDLAIQCCEETPQDLGEFDSLQNVILDQLRYIRQSRSGEAPKDASSGKRNTLYLYFMARKGVATYVSEDGEKILRFSIPITRQELLEASKSDKKLELPEEVRTLIETERAAGKEVDISFSDRICWYQEKDALLDANWPFTTPLRPNHSTNDKSEPRP